MIQAKKHLTTKKVSPSTSCETPYVINGAFINEQNAHPPQFSLYLNHSYSIDFWVIGLIYGLQAMGVILSAQLWAKWFEHQSITVSLVRLKWIIFTCVIVVICLALTPIIFGLPHCTCFGSFTWCNNANTHGINIFNYIL